MFRSHFTFDFSKYFCDAIFLTFSIWKGCARVFLFFFQFSIWLLFMYTFKRHWNKNVSTTKALILFVYWRVKIVLKLICRWVASVQHHVWMMILSDIHSKYKLHAAYWFWMYVLFVSKTRLLNFQLFILYILHFVHKYCVANDEWIGS